MICTIHCDGIKAEQRVREQLFNMGIEPVAHTSSQAEKFNEVSVDVPEHTREEIRSWAGVNLVTWREE